MVNAPIDVDSSDVVMKDESNISHSTVYENVQESCKQLPIYSMRKKIIQMVRKNECVIFLGETGCGKTTQIPRFLYEAYSTQKLFKGQICCTQPRRVAAISIAQRVAEECGQQCGQLVGYSVRFEDQTSKSTKIKYMTDGMLLREALIDPHLKRYRIIILDEAHERTLHTDLLFGIVKQALEKRRQSKRKLHILVMSATMDVKLFSDYFNSCPVLYLEGRQFHIDVYHLEQKQTDYQHSALITLFQIHRSTPPSEGILLFLTGQDEIDSTCKTIRQIADTSSVP
ncbi:unnamed protein product, partial [Didymodactylos carnosus]